MIKIAFLFFIISYSVFPQVTLRASMGINFQNTPSLNDYLNQNYASSFDQLSEFKSAINFTAEGGYMISPRDEIALEFGYLINSYTYNSTIGQYELFYNVLMPSVLYNYVIGGEGYQIRLGAGGGPRFSMVEETYPGTGSPIEYSAAGWGIILKADGNTLLGGNIYANIGIDFRYDFNGEPDNESLVLNNPVTDENVNLNALAFGIHLGIAYRFE